MILEFLDFVVDGENGQKTKTMTNILSNDECSLVIIYIDK